MSADRAADRWTTRETSTRQLKFGSGVAKDYVRPRSPEDATRYSSTRACEAARIACALAVSSDVRGGGEPEKERRRKKQKGGSAHKWDTRNLTSSGLKHRGARELTGRERKRKREREREREKKREREREREEREREGWRETRFGRKARLARTPPGHFVYSRMYSYVLYSVQYVRAQMALAHEQVFASTWWFIELSTRTSILDTRYDEHDTQSSQE